jgi:AcrR family transcriptional regulator
MKPRLAQVRRAADKAERARADFETAIRRAAEEHSLREVAEAAGLTKTRIHQIVRGR